MPNSDAHEGQWHFPLLGLDISETRIGLAMAEHPDVFPYPMLTYTRVTRERDLAQCDEWTRRYHVGGVVLGLPLNMDGSEGPRARWMRRFARHLQERITVPVLLQDERLTTVEADELLVQRGEK
ncbi:MAG TPA: Holliday junction resolvase RuvX, partial [Armatimonadota bacterium]